MTMLRYIECGKVPISTLAAPPLFWAMPRRKGIFLGFLLIRPIITIQSFSSSSLYVQVRQEESFEEEATFARPPPPRRRPDSFQVAFHNNATMILMRMMKFLTVQ